MRVAVAREFRHGIEDLAQRRLQRLIAAGCLGGDIARGKQRGARCVQLRARLAYPGDRLGEVQVLLQGQGHEPRELLITPSQPPC
ncbi:hypothetical protein D3C78_1387080 [compost metagenome]